MLGTHPAVNNIFKGPIDAKRRKPDLVSIATALGLPIRNKNRTQLIEAITAKLSSNPELEDDPKFKLLFSTAHMLEGRRTSEMKDVEDQAAATKQAETGKMSS